MKYKAGQLKSGLWAVKVGKRYFKDTVCDSQDEAIIQACELSAQWYHAQLDRCRSVWEDTHRQNGKKDHYEEGAVGGNVKDFEADWGGVLC